MRSRREPRLPVAALLRASGADVAVVPFSRPSRASRVHGRLNYEIDGSIAAPTGTLAELIGVDKASINRWRRDGGVPLTAAEDACFALGLHPACVWGDDWLFAAGCPLARVVRRLSVMT